MAPPTTAQRRGAEPHSSPSAWAPAVTIPAPEQQPDLSPAKPSSRETKAQEHQHPPNDPLVAHLRSYLSPSLAKYPLFRALLFQHHTVPQALAIILAAVVANHARRVLAPWLGQFLFYHPVDDLKLARTVPYQLLEVETLTFTWVELALWGVNVFLVGVLESALAAWLTLQAEDLQQKKSLSGRERVNMDIALAGYLCLRIMAMEYAFAATFWALGVIYAYGILALPSPPTTPEAAAAFLWHLVGTHWRKLPVQAALVLNVLVGGVIPDANAALLGCLRGRPGLAVYLAGWTGLVAHVVRYSSRYFVLIEMSDLVVTWVEIAMGVGWVVVAGGRKKMPPHEKRTS